jgi:hypothetical protein
MMVKKININLISKWDYDVCQLIHYKNKYKHHRGMFALTMTTYLDL